MGAAERIDAGELDEALERLLALSAEGGPATPLQIRSFRRYVEVCGLCWEGFRIGPASAPRGLFLGLLLPGRTAIVIIPQLEWKGVDRAAQGEVLEQGLESLRKRELHFAQALIEPGEDRRRELLEAAGFGHLAPLEYLERDVVYPWTEAPPEDDVAWVRYSDETHERFVRVIGGTYVDSRDCPELSDLRSPEEALEAHRASGPFDPGLWEIVQTGGGDAGCLLLSRTIQPQVAEIVYVGVLPAWRGRGVGSVLLRRAVARSRELRQRRITTVVDARNEAARGMYSRFSFERVGFREAWLYRWGRKKGAG